MTTTKDTTTRDAETAARRDRRPMVYSANRWQRSLLDRYRDADEGYRGKEEDLAEAWPGTPSLADEFYARMYSRYVPQVPEDERPPEAGLASKLHDQVEALPEWKNLLRATRYSAHWSGVGTSAMLDEVADVLRDHAEKMQEAGMQQSVPSWIACDCQAQAEAEGDTDAAARYMAQVQAAEAADLIDHDDSEIRRALRAGIERAVTEIQEAKDAEAVMWGNAPGAIRPSTEGSLDNPHVSQLLSNPRFREILRAAGRLFSIATTKRRERVDYARTEVSDVTINGDLARALPTELMRMKHPRLRLLFLKDLVGHNLLSYKMTGKEPTAKGPVTMLIDVSGSMNRNRETWAKAVSLAVVNVCRREKRRVDAMFFNTGIVSTWQELDKRFPTDPEAVKFVTTWGDGGTNYYTPLNHVLNVAQTASAARAGKGRPDVIMVTDGECKLEGDQRAAIMKAKEATGASVYVINVSGRRLDPSAVPWADEVYSVNVDSRTPDDAAAHPVFARL